MGEGHAIDPQGSPDVWLLPGEVADSDLRDDAEHWATVYQELIGFLVRCDAENAMLERFRRRLRFGVAVGSS